ncbi:unnamed protein product, partial [Phaeothamnion confervicola]
DSYFGGGQGARACSGGRERAAAGEHGLHRCPSDGLAAPVRVVVGSRLAGTAHYFWLSHYSICPFPSCFLCGRCIESILSRMFHWHPCRSRNAVGFSHEKWNHP